MAITITTISAGSQSFTADVIADADGDLGSGPIAHGLGTAPIEVTITPLLANFYLSAWSVTTIDGTNVTLTKANAGGSGAAGAQVRVTAKRPHSIVR